ncbi:MAG: hypothetical protein WA982_17660 [Rubrobacteraceae bacterium]
MIGELWQFFAAASVGVIAITLWIFLIYLPRRKWDGDGNKKDHDDQQP